LIGTAETGKSTVVKQMKIMYKNGFSEQERLQFLPIIHQNIVDCVCFLLNEINKRGLTYIEPQNNVSVRCDCGGVK
jgi:hypothetical protein